MATARILIVEDERLIAQGLWLRVTALGHTVVGLAASGEEPIAQAAALEPDIILMDIGFRGAMDGIDAARHIRARAQIPVIYLSAYADEPTLARVADRARWLSGETRARSRTPRTLVRVLGGQSASGHGMRS